MSTDQELKKTNSSHKEFQSLLDQDFKDRKLKENEIIKATVSEITKNFIVVDCKAKMEGMIPIEEFKNDDELSKIKVGSQIDVYLERIESFKGEIIVSRDKARKMKAWKKLEKVFETQEEMTGYITGKVKGGFITTVDGLPCFMPSSQIDIRPLKQEINISALLVIFFIFSVWILHNVVVALLCNKSNDKGNPITLLHPTITMCFPKISIL